TRGDLYLEVLFNPHKIFRADNLDIHMDLPVTPWEVALGTKLTVPTLGGNVDLQIPVASQNGKKLRLKGRGLPGNPAGDQIVTLKVWVPEAKTPQAKKLYEQMAREMRANPRQYLGT
ncbi:cytochrome C biogenesis protein, partial [Achromatium sp. WMS1]